MPSKDEVQYIAHLSRIHLRQDEIERLTTDLEAILEYIEKLKSLDISRVKPTSHVLPIKNVFREDTPKPSLEQDDIAQFAVKRQDDFFKVPKVIE